MATEAGTNDTPNVIAIDIGGGTTKLALVDACGTIRNWQAFPTAGTSAADYMARLVSAALEFTAAHPVAGVAVAVAGFVGRDGSLAYNANLPWLQGTQIRATLAEAMQLPVQVDADSNTACVAEFLFGQGRGFSRFLCLTGGTGLGAGMVAEGRLLRIAHGCLGDAGHVIVSPQGPVCSCGGRGCAEALLSTAALAERYAELCGREGLSFRQLVQDAKQLDAGQGNPSACLILEEAGQWLGIAAASLANIFFPDRIAVAGGLSQAGDAFFNAALTSFRAHLGTLPLAGVSLIRATTGEHATLLGAAASFFHPEIL